MDRKEKPQDKRKNPRINFRLSVQAKGHRETLAIINFSLYGMLLEADDTSKYTPGDTIFLDMRLPHNGERLELEGRVTHVSGAGVGVAFPEISPQKAMALETCFRIFKETLPLPDPAH